MWSTVVLQKYPFLLVRFDFSQISEYFVPNWKLYLSHTANSLIVSNFKVHLSQIPNCISLILQNILVSNYKYICLKFQNVFVLNCQMYLSQIAKFSDLKKGIQNIWSRMYFSYISVTCQLHFSYISATFLLHFSYISASFKLHFD